jgi:hypothetical protein
MFPACAVATESIPIPIVKKAINILIRFIVFPFAE